MADQDDRTFLTDCADAAHASRLITTGMIIRLLLLAGDAEAATYWARRDTGEAFRVQKADLLQWVQRARTAQEITA